LIYTVGHSTRSLEEFFSLLKKEGIEVLVDVRRFPTSKKFPHFSRDVLRKRCLEKGIKYIWLGDKLGGYRKGGYKEHMKKKEFLEGIKEIEKVSIGRKVCIMCSEKIVFRCHRRFISAYLKMRGHTVVHIVDEKRKIEEKGTLFLT